MDTSTFLKQILNTFVVALFVFLMVNEFYGEVMLQTLVQAAGEESILMILVFLGFLVTFLVSIGVAYLTAEAYERRRVFAASVLAMLVSMSILILLSYSLVIQAYPDVIPSFNTGSWLQDMLQRAWVYVIAIPRMLAYFAVYILTDVTTFYFLSIGVYTVCFTLFLFQFTKR